MNYGRKKAAKKRRDITSKSKMKKKRLGVRIFKGVLLTLLLLMVAGCVGGGIFLKKVIDSAPDVTPEDVKQKIKVIIEEENKKKPYSDDEIVNKLNDENINISRRTVSKYRKELNIPTSYNRKE